MLIRSGKGARLEEDCEVVIRIWAAESFFFKSKDLKKKDPSGSKRSDLGMKKKSHSHYIYGVYYRSTNRRRDKVIRRKENESKKGA